MEINDVFKAVCRKLKDKFPTYNVYGEKQAQGFKAPAFFVYLVPIYTSNETENRTYKRVSIKIIYMGKGANAENREMEEALNSVFRLHLAVGEKVLHICDTASQVIDEDLHFSFDVSYYRFVFDDDYFTQYDLMQNLFMERK